MRRGVIPPGSVALFDIDCRDNEVANPERTIFHRYFMNDEPGDRRISIIYFRGEFPRSNFADVTDLTARFGVKWRLVQNHAAIITAFQFFDLFVTVEYRNDLCVFDLR